MSDMDRGCWAIWEGDDFETGRDDGWSRMTIGRKGGLIGLFNLIKDSVVISYC